MSTTYPLAVNNKIATNVSLNKLAKLKLGKGELLRFTENFRDQMEAGRPTMQVLTEMEKMSDKNPNLKLVVGTLVRELESGKKLSDGMRLFPAIFSKSYCALVAAGEQGGRLTKKRTGDTVKPGTLDLNIAYLKRVDSARQKVISGLMYPAIIGVFLLIAVGIFSFFILPSLKEVFVALNLEKSFGLMGNLLFGMADFVQIYYYTFPFILAGLGVGIWQFWKAFGNNLWQHYQFKLPVVRSLFSKLVVAETCSLFSTLISAGLTTYESLAILQSSTRNREIAKAFELADVYIRQGKTLSESLKDAHYLFDGETYQTLHSAEVTGKIDDILGNHANRLYEQLDSEIDNLIKGIEPACLAIAGVLVGYLLISYYGTISAALANIR